MPSTIFHGTFQLYNRFNSFDSRVPIIYHTNYNYDNDLVVFVHGRNGHPSNFNPLIENLKKLGITQSMISINLGATGNTSVITDSGTLHNLLRKFIHRKIILVGLSKGGLVVLDYIVSYQATNISAVITISSPLNGTLIADYLLPKTHIARIELGYQSSFVQGLQSNLPSNIPIFHIVPTWDQMIIPTSSAFINKPNHKVKYYTGFISHVGIPYAQDVAQFIADWIQELK